jgi:hypothetical protein
MWGRRRAVDRGPLILVGVTLTCLALVAALSTSPDQSASAASAAFAPGIGSATFVATPDADGVWFHTTWPSATTINHVSLTAAGVAGTLPRQSIITFSDGSNLMLTPDARGDVDISIAPRKITSASIRIVAAGTHPPMEIASYAIDASGAPLAHGGGVAEASSGTATALSDGSVVGGQTGAVWKSATGDAAPWAGIRYPTAREIASVQLFGAPSSGAASWGDLVFSDGSTVRVTSVDGAGGQPTTIAFTPRMTTTVRYVPQSTGALTLRELVVGERGTTLPRLPVTGATYTVATPPAATGCGLTSTAVGAVAVGGIALVCPAVGSTVSATASVIVSGPVGATVRASAWVPSGAKDTDGAIATVGTAVVDATGRAAISFNAAKLDHGPFAIRVTVDGSTPIGDRLLYVQLFNSGGVAVGSSGFAPNGMTLAWADDFSTGVSATSKGLGSVYGTLQPQPGKAGQFGEAVFANPANGAGTIGTLDSSSLRIRAMPFTGTDSTGWGRTMQAGMLSSGHWDGSGTLAQYGYFEVRALGAPGRGSWPAFWMLNGDVAAGRGATSSEVDATELYGQSPIYGCQTVHLYQRSPSSETSKKNCAQFGVGDGWSTDDWALRWHSYGVLIAPNVTKFYLDGQLVSTRNEIATSDQPYFFMLDEALGGGYQVQLQQTGNVSDFYVDWVKVSS